MPCVCTECRLVACARLIGALILMACVIVACLVGWILAATTPQLEWWQ